MVDQKADDIRVLRREIAELRGILAVFRSAMALGPDETWDSMAGRIRRQTDDATVIAGQAMMNISILYENAVISQSGRSWQALAMPSGATGLADYRPASDGSLALRFALAWRNAPGTASISGVPKDLWPAAEWSDGPVSVAMNGLVTLSVTGTQFGASLLVPTR